MHTQKKTGTKKISDELIYDVCSYIRVGAPIETAAIAAGIDKSDYLLWMREGKSTHHYDNCQDCDFALFYRQITIARAQTVALFFASITQAGANGDWKASVWWLEKYGNLDQEDNSQSSNETTYEEIQLLTEKILRMRNSQNN
jgi:hypothetical protein